jgi:hypothetical protein
MARAAAPVVTVYGPLGRMGLGARGSSPGAGDIVGRRQNITSWPRTADRWHEGASSAVGRDGKSLMPRTASAIGVAVRVVRALRVRPPDPAEIGIGERGTTK